MTTKRVITFIIFFLFHTLATATKLTECFDQAAVTYNVDSNLLKAIAKVESNFNSKALNINKNGTKDYGLMQINSWWLNKLEGFGITKKDLKEDPCINIHVGAWVLAENFNSHGVNWNSVGAYNAGFKKDNIHKALRQKYAQKVYRHYERFKNTP